MKGEALMFTSLEIKALNIEEIANKHRLPAYIYFQKIIERQLNILKENFKDFDIFYSFKSNPNKNICCFIKRQGLFADTASIGEVRLAEDCCFSRDEIIYSSPGKKEKEIKEALGKAIIIADSLNELQLINEVCRKQNIIEEIGIRINPDYSMGDAGANEIMSGISSKFGIDQEEIKTQINYIHSLTNVKITGLQIYMGSQIVDREILYNNFYNIFKVAAFCKAELEFDIKFIDFGGGFGVQHTIDEKGLDIEWVGKKVAELIASPEFNPLGNPRLIIESGRFISAPCGVYVTPVLDVKTSRGKKYAILDGGMNTFFRPMFMKETKYPIAVINKLDEKQREKITLGGVMCTPIDIFLEDVMLPPLEKGDILAFFNTGAYGYTMSLTKFISHDEANEIYIGRRMENDFR